MRQRLGIALLLVALVMTAATAVGDHGSDGTELQGLVQAMPAGLFGDWTVAGRIVHVSAATEVRQDHGAAGVGAFVEVRGSSRPDGSIDASRLEVRTPAPAAPAAAEARFTGVVESLPASGLIGDWMVAGKTVHVGTLTRIETEHGLPAVGAMVEVRGTLQADGSVAATRLDVRESAQPPAPASTEFRGAIESLPAGPGAGDWMVGGKLVHVTAMTKLESEGGSFVVGAFVEVTGVMRSDGSVDATSIELKFSPGAGAASVEIRGAVESLSASPEFLGDWMVSGTTVHVSAVTSVRLEGHTLAVGSFVEVRGTRRADGSVDAARVELVWGPETSGAVLTTVGFVASTARVPGRNGSFFTTSLTLSNPTSSAVQVELRFHGHDRDGREAQSRRLTLAAQETRTIDDVLGSVLGIGNDFGSLEIASNSGALLVSSRTGTPGAVGSFGQEIPAAGRADLVREGSDRRIAGVRHDGSVRTNLILANSGEIETDVRIELEGRDGSVLGSVRLTLRPLEMRQFNDVARSLGAPDGFRDGRLKLSTPTANGAFAAFASEIDNGTNDPRTLLPR